VNACARIRRAAAAIASLPPADRERAAAEAHAAGCPECERALREGERLQALLATAPLPAPSPEALARASRAVLAEIRRERRAGWLELAPAALLVLASLVFAALAGGPGPLAAATGARCAAEELLAAAIPAGAALLLARGWRPRLAPALAAAGGAAGALAWQLVLHGDCAQSGAAPHLAFHVGGVLAAALLALAGGRRVAAGASA
jgi:hypothetical protein